MSELIDQYFQLQEVNVVVLAHRDSVTDKTWNDLVSDGNTIILSEYEDEFIFCNNTDLLRYINDYGIIGGSDSLEEFLLDDISSYVFDDLSLDHPLISIFEYELSEKLVIMIKDTFATIQKYSQNDLFGLNFIKNVKATIEPIIFTELALLMKLKSKEYASLSRI